MLMEEGYVNMDVSMTVVQLNVLDMDIHVRNLGIIAMHA
jgi:hypothetical protein